MRQGLYTRRTPGSEKIDNDDITLYSIKTAGANRIIDSTGKRKILHFIIQRIVVLAKDQSREQEEKKEKTFYHLLLVETLAAIFTYFTQIKICKTKAMNNLWQNIGETKDWLLNKGFDKPLAGIVLGTGLGALVEKINIKLSIPYQEIPHFPLSTVEFHKGHLIYGELSGVTVIAMQGRFHYYEGYSMHQIIFPIRVMKELGIQNLLLSNAAGGMNLTYKKGDLVIIEDHISLLPDNPLREMNDPVMGNRFADMSCPYDKKLRQMLAEAFAKQNIPVKEGVYVSVMGPSLETRAEYRWLRSMGADMVGMSTVPEVIVAAQMGLPCAAVSVITDECDPDNLKPIDIPEIMEVAAKADKKLSEVFAEVIGKLN